ncbi:MAG: hypothetical protein A3E27_04845 [Deltaproteobacteria bacterium RIFCSPHIGHO2_12_FULL_40_32]|nr:MAG: hypothetical protein A3E27_04845 [Deltaproteobacteria bacterium RIFCSPHIGHO2_12_FULL_40_32]
MDFSMSSILLSLATSIIGIYAFKYGKQNQSARHMILGIILMIYTYFISNIWLELGTGALLTGLLFWP